MFSVILHGRKSLELQKWCHFRVSVSLFQNAFSSATASGATDVTLLQDGRKGENFTVSYLVESLGFTTRLAESVWKKVSSEGKKGNPDSVLNLLRRHGFTDSQISTIVSNYPKLLIADTEKSVGPKLQFLKSRGASTSELTEILTKAPKILGKKGEQTIGRYYDLVKEIVEADKSSKFEKLCFSLPKGSRQENKLRNVLVLREMGVPQKSLLSLLISSSHRFCCGKERFEESLKKVVEMGFDPTTFRFVEALRFLYQLSQKTIEEKVNFYKRLGFAMEDVWEMFKKNPNFLPLSEKKILNSMETLLALGFSRDEFMMMVKYFPSCIGYSSELLKKKIEFLVKQMNWPVKAVSLFPQSTSYSMEKRIVPRCNVIKALMSKGLLGEGELPSIPSVLACTDQVFLKKYVMRHDDKELVRELMAIFTKYRAL